MYNEQFLQLYAFVIDLFYTYLSRNYIVDGKRKLFIIPVPNTTREFIR